MERGGCGREGTRGTGQWISPLPATRWLYHMKFLVFDVTGLECPLNPAAGVPLFTAPQGRDDARLLLSRRVCSGEGSAAEHNTSTRRPRGGSTCELSDGWWSDRAIILTVQFQRSACHHHMLGDGHRDGVLICMVIDDRSRCFLVPLDLAPMLCVSLVRHI